MDNKLLMLQEAIKILMKFYIKTAMLPYRKKKVRSTLTKLFILYEIISKKKIQRSVWVRPIYTVEQRFLQGDSNNLVTMLRTTDPSLYFNYFRMQVDIFDKLFVLMGSKIEKEYFIREPISSRTRLEICIRYLASGDSMKSVGYAFRVAPNTVSKIVHETCNEIWNTLKDIVMPVPSTQKWENIAQDFEKLWNFPHCIGAIDGRHMVIEAPPYSGSVYFNYKKTHSINFTGVSDAHYRFILIDVGAEGRRSDGGVFANSSIQSGLQSNTLNVPLPAPVGERELSYVLVGDEAYPLAPYLMRPYPRRSNLDLRKKVYNYRLSRARRIIENAFGILVARWRIFRKPINLTVSKAEKIVLATICLHNFIITNEMEKRPQERQYLCYNDNDKQQTSSLTTLPRIISQDLISQRNLSTIYRERFADYFFNEGAVEWQWEKAEHNDF